MLLIGTWLYEARNLDWVVSALFFTKESFYQADQTTATANHSIRMTKRLVFEIYLIN